jgi:hypothetical protein
MDDDDLRITVAQAHSFSERKLRELFVRVVNNLTYELAETFTKDVDFLGEDGDRAPSVLTTEQMRRAILRHQYWFNPKTTRLAAND